MYCPTCLNNTLKVQSKGVIKLQINKKHRDANIIIYNLAGDGKANLVQDIGKKIDEFFTWFAGFSTKDSIKSIHLFSNNFECSRGCAIDFNSKMSISDVIVTKKEIHSIVTKYCNKYNLLLDPDFEIL